MTEQERLLAAVRGEWEPGSVIAKRAGIDPKTAGPRLAALAKQGMVVRYTPTEFGDKLVYARGPCAPSLNGPLKDADLLRDLRVKLKEMKAVFPIGNPLDEGYEEARREIEDWLDEHEVPS